MSFLATLRIALAALRVNKLRSALTMLGIIIGVGAVIAMTRSLALALGSKGITVNAVPPSFIDTPGLRAGEEMGFLDVEKFAKMIPVRRVGEPEDIAATVAFLTRDDASFVTGQVVGVNGGRVMQ